MALLSEGGITKHYLVEEKPTKMIGLLRLDKFGFLRFMRLNVFSSIGFILFAFAVMLLSFFPMVSFGFCVPRMFFPNVYLFSCFSSATNEGFMYKFERESLLAM